MERYFGMTLQYFGMTIYYDNKFFSVEKVNKLLIGPRKFFFLSLPVEKRNHNHYLLKKIVDSEFDIGETI